jgi:S-adenosylmethionine-dependent methyltransferase
MAPEPAELQGARLRSAVEALYDRDSQREWDRAERHRTEFAVTLRALAQHLPPPPARILDCGGGPGRYAIALARQGYDVTLFDLSGGNLALAREKAAETGVTLAFEQGTALDLSRFRDHSFDAVLLMGPLYHLLTEEERLAALVEARRVLQPGGPLFAAFITRWAAHRTGAMLYPAEPLEIPADYQSIEQTGILAPREGAQFVAYFARPGDVEPLVRRAGLEVEEVLGVEGVVSIIEKAGVNDLGGSAWDWWLETNWRAAHDRELFGAVEHLLVVAHNPAWRSVLRGIAAALNAAVIPYSVVGGACVALHGVPVHVKDIDIQTTAEGAQRCAEIFAANTVTPVTFSDNGAYRSHFGRFSFDGIEVEVMGDQERWQDGRWQDTMAATQAIVDMDGVPVSASWLEEEWLATIRRGRLERAALVLPHCDRDRLLALVRGQVKTAVL